jgi:hypothetical protein
MFNHKPRTFAAILSLLWLFANPISLTAQTAAQTPAASPSLEQRVTDLEPYVNNGARTADAVNAPVGSMIAGPAR